MNAKDNSPSDNVNTQLTRMAQTEAKGHIDVHYRMDGKTSSPVLSHPMNISQFGLSKLVEETHFF